MGIYNVSSICIGSVLLRKKIDTQSDLSESMERPMGRYANHSNDLDNFFLFSPPDYSLVGDFVCFNCFRIVT